MSLLCKIGLHRWKQAGSICGSSWGHPSPEYNLEYTYQCKGCGKWRGSFPNINFNHSLCDLNGPVVDTYSDARAWIKSEVERAWEEKRREDDTR